jgi:3-hydroxymyristoyl/3-hydroxydecanoyl-(acyl carrier protein) dehydratase
VVAVLALGATWRDLDPLRWTAALLAVGLLLVRASRARWLGVVVLLAFGVSIFGGFGAATLLDAAPAFVAAFLTGLFARTLRRGHTPLIARAIAALDGPTELADPGVRRYARTLTWAWVWLQGTLALLAALLALHDHGLVAGLPAWVPSAGSFGEIGLPLASLLLLVAEFFWRRVRWPRAPRRSLLGFLIALIRAWPKLLDEPTPGVCEKGIHIAASHPALPGHFPGRPIVPGVVLLDWIVASVERTYGLPVVALPVVKFHRPLTPGRTARLRFEHTGQGVRFRLYCAEAEIVSGMLELASA